MDPRSPPRVTEELARRLELAEVGFMLEWLEGAARLPGNPRGLRIERFGEAVAPASTAEPELDFMNRVMGLFPPDVGHVGDILAFYKELRIRPWFELIQSTGFESLAVALTEGGASQIGFHTVLYGMPSSAPPASRPDVQIRMIAAGEADTFTDTLLRGFELSEEDLPDAKRDHAHWLHLEGWRLYLATVGDEPAAAAVLRIAGGAGQRLHQARVQGARMPERAHSSTDRRRRRRGLRADRRPSRARLRQPEEHGTRGTSRGVHQGRMARPRIGAKPMKPSGGR